MKRNQLTAAVLAALGLYVPMVAAQAPETENAVAPRQFEEVFVLGEFVPVEKRDTSEISNLLSNEDLNLVPETNVGAALSRVAGLSLVGGKYVYVRGLGERYSSTLLNRARISSPVPFQKTVPLDIVPNNIVKSLLVQKTYSVEYPGDFSGGVVDIRTKTTPDEDYLILKGNVGGNSKTTNGDGLTYKGGQKDKWGYDDGTRAIPRNVQALTTTEFDQTVYPERANLGASFYDKWDIYEKKIDPNFTGEAEWGKRLEFDNGMVLGFIGNYKYSNRWTNIDKNVRRYEFTGVDGGSNQTVDYNRFITTNYIDKSGFGNIGLELNENNSVTFNATKLQQSTDQLQQDKGLSSEDNVANGTEVQNYLLQWAENQIESYQLSGSHYFPSLDDARITWRAVDGSGKRDSPDTRTYSYAEGNSGNMEMVSSTRQSAGDLRDVYQAPERGYSKLKDNINEYGADFELPFTLLNIESTFTAGYSDYDRTRKTNDRLFRFDITSSAPYYVSWETPNQVFGDDNWIDQYVSIRDFTNSAANASGIFPYAESSETVTAYYGSLDSQVLPTVRVQIGARVEDFTLEADAWGGNTDKGTDNKVKNDAQDTLPAASVTWEFIENMQLRFAYSETVNRPSLLEVTGSTLRNPEDQNLYRGNVYLEEADLTNYDMRWEWYFGNVDEMSLGLFYKEFKNPIELAKVQAQGDIYTWFNADKAELQGIEYDVRKELPLGEWFGLDPVWNGFSVALNASYIDSKVTLLGPGETADDIPLTGGRKIAPLYSNERKMTGQSDWLGNLLVSYTDADLGVTSSVLYNYTDERIVLVGDNNAPDIVEEGRGVVDVLAKYEFPWKKYSFEVEAKAGNILNTKVEWTQGGQRYENWQPGITYSLGLRATF
jgi:TonB-dependent receptor